MKKQGFLYGSAILMASAAVTKIIGAMFKIPLANMLGGIGMGYFSSAYSLFMVVYAVCVTGLPSAVAKSAAEASCGSEEENAERVACIESTALRIFGAAGLAASLLIMAAAYPFCKYVTGDMGALPAVIMIAPCVLAGSLASVYRGCCEGMRNMYPTALSQVFEALIKLIFGLLLCGAVLYIAENKPQTFMKIFRCSEENIGRASVIYAAAGSVLGITLSSFGGLLWLILQKKLDKSSKRVYNKKRCIGSERRRIVSDILKTAFPAALGALVTNLTSVIDLATIMRSLDRLSQSAPQIFSELVQSGIAKDDIPGFVYGSFTGLAVTVFNLVPAVTNMLGKGMLPSAAAANALGDKKRLGECAYTVLLSSALISVPAGGGLCVMSRYVLELLFSGSPLETNVSVVPLSVLALALPFLCVASSSFAVFTAVGRADIPVRLMAWGAIVKLVGNLVLTSVPELNVTGAALSTLICYVFICSAALMRLRSVCSPDMRSLAAAAAGIIPSAVLCCAGSLILRKRLDGCLDGWIATVISCCFGAILYIVGTKISGVITKNTVKMLIS